MRIRAASQTIEIGSKVKIVSSKRSVKSKPSWQEEATVGPKRSWSAAEHGGQLVNIAIDVVEVGEIQ